MKYNLSAMQEGRRIALDPGLELDNPDRYDPTPRRCDCENDHCKVAHRAGDCQQPEAVKTLWNSGLCAECAPFMPAEYKAAGFSRIEALIAALVLLLLLIGSPVILVRGQSTQKPTQTIVETKPIYTCGAPTKKGTACKHRVKTKGAVCWQHQKPKA